MEFLHFDILIGKSDNCDINFTCVRPQQDLPNGYNVQCADCKNLPTIIFFFILS